MIWIFQSTFGFISICAQTEMKVYRVNMWSNKSSPSEVVGFLYQHYLHKSVAAQIFHDAGLGTVRHTDDRTRNRYVQGNILPLQHNGATVMA